MSDDEAWPVPPVGPSSGDGPSPADPGSSPPGRYPSLGSLIDVPPVQTVVHLSDLARPESRKRLAESFVLTDEVRNHLKRLLASLRQTHGMGAFLRGHYGAGKSHFLAFLELLLQGEVDRQAMASLEPELAAGLEALGERRFLVASISLVGHAANHSLEAVVTHALEALHGPAPLPFPDGETLQAHLDTFRYHLRRFHPDALEQTLHELELTEKQLFSADHMAELDRLAREVRYTFRPDPGRSARFDHLIQQLEEAGLSGCVLLIDELSEFLHARQGVALTEDVRFLQFLGELARERRLWVVAALQEYLEAAEYGLPGELVRKIKDRFPHILELTSTHIEEIVHKRLIHLKPGAEPVLAALYQEMRETLQGFPVPLARFLRVYPVHPATVLLLDRLRPLLSRSRGIVDFVHHRLAGSLERGIPSRLDLPADQLLTPDVLFDHFQLRIRENLETAAFESTVWEYYRRTLPELFPDSDTVVLAGRLVKLLILLAISPEARPYSVRTLAHALLVRVSRLDAEAGFQWVQELLEVLVLRGAFVERVAARADGQRSFEDVYRISLKADVQLVVARRTQAAVHSLQDAPPLRIFEALAPGLALESMPLSRLVHARTQLHSIAWQRTQRDGRVILGSLTSLDVPKLLELCAELEETELDWALFVGLPYEVESQQTHVQEVLLPALRRMERPCTRALLFWLPVPLTFEGADGVFLRETLARRAVLTRAREESGSSQARELVELLEKAVESDRARVEAIFHHAWYHGTVISTAGAEESLANLGRPLFAQTLLALLTPALAARFPEHAVVAPLGRAPALDDVEAVVDRLFRVGSFTPKGGEADPFGTRVSSLLRPLGLVKKVGAALTLAPEPTRPGPVRTLLALLEAGPRAQREVYLAMRKGPYGIALPMFQLLTLGLTYAGLVTCHSGEKKREPSQLSALNFDQITHLSKATGEVLDVSSLCRMPFLSEGALPRGELSFGRLEQLWQAIREARGRLAALVERVRAGSQRAQGLRALARLHWEVVREDLAILEPLASVGGTGVGPREGIQQTLELLETIGPELPGVLERVQRVGQFLGAGVERVVLIHAYLERIGALPADLDWGALRAQREEVLERLSSETLLHQPGQLELLVAAFRSFQEGWTTQYREAHARARGPQRFQALEALRTSARFQLLARLSRVRSLAAGDRAALLERRLEQLVSSRCLRLEGDELRTNPLCSCGFTLDTSAVALPLEALEAEVEAGLLEYASALAQPEIQTVLQGFIRQLDAIGRQDEASSIRGMLQQASGWRASVMPALTSELTDEGSSDKKTDGGGSSEAGKDGGSEGSVSRERLHWEAQAGAALLSFRPERLQLLEQALAGAQLVEERSLAGLLSGLQGRCLKRTEVRELLLAWLGPGNDTWLRIVD